MKGRLSAVALVAIAVTACSGAQHSRPQRETPECRNYRIMMTAPMPPETHARLKVACEQSTGNARATR